MGKHKERPRYNVVSVRVSDVEKAYLTELSKLGRTTITKLMREAMHSYFSDLASLQEQR